MGPRTVWCASKDSVPGSRLTINVTSSVSMALSSSPTFSSCAQIVLRFPTSARNVTFVDASPVTRSTPLVPMSVGRLWPTLLRSFGAMSITAEGTLAANIFAIELLPTMMFMSG